MKKIIKIGLLLSLLIVATTIVIVLAIDHTKPVLLHFDTDGGNVIDSKEYQTLDGIITEGLPTPTKTGFDFVGWYLDASRSSRPYDPFTSKITKETKFYAKYEVKVFKITFSSNIDLVFNDIYVKYNDVVGYEPKVVVSGMNFLGWYSDENLTIRIDLITTPIEKDYVLYGKWDMKNCVINYHVNSNLYTSTTARYSSNVVLPTEPSVYGYKFMGWYTDSGFNFPYTPGKYDQLEMNLYAKMVEVYTFIYVLNGVIIHTCLVGVNEELPAIDNPSLSDFIFDGWYTDSSYTTKATNWLQPASDLAYYGRFIPA